MQGLENIFGVHKEVREIARGLSGLIKEQDLLGVDDAEEINLLGKGDKKGAKAAFFVTLTCGSFVRLRILRDSSNHRTNLLRGKQ